VRWGRLLPHGGRSRPGPPPPGRHRIRPLLPVLFIPRRRRLPGCFSALWPWPVSRFWRHC